MTLAKRIAPIIDLDSNNEVVNAFERGGMTVPHVEAIARYHENDGADEIWIRIAPDDKRGASAHFDTLKGVRPRVQVPLVVWGGVHSAADARLLVGLGADRVVLDAHAFEAGELLDQCRDISNSIGVVGLSVALTTRRHVAPQTGWASGGTAWALCDALGAPRNEDALAVAKRVAEAGAGEIVIQPSQQAFATGVASGHDPELVERLLSSLPIQIVSSGRDNDAADLGPPLLMGADGVASATLFSSGDCTIKDTKAALAEFGIALRPTIAPYAL